MLYEAWNSAVLHYKMFSIWFLLLERGRSRFGYASSIYRTNGIEKAIIHFCQLDLDKKDEKIIYDLILNAYRELDSKDPLE